MKSEKYLAKQLLNAVWDENIKKVEALLEEGADPNWIFNGYPILLHAVFTRNQEMVMLLIEKGASQVREALGFALDRGIGELVMPLAFLGIIPKHQEVKARFGPYPSRYAPLGYSHFSS
ncbi:MAG: ankyrin repeat domain-containing protein [Erysipelotrichaceae bacterium]|nr:ankyrin repeat domain-containing protein [Erysipelotrichaceae bacterium]